MPSVSLVILATGRYGRFVAPLVESARRHLVGLETVFVLGDAPPDVTADDVRWLPWGHTPWPYASLLRYRALLAYADVIDRNDTIVHTDVDMRFVARAEFPVQGLFAVTHPGYADSPRDAFPYESNHRSQAFVAPPEGSVYVAGGVQGGDSRAYLDACADMAAMIQMDLDNGIVPTWHDESIWNRYCIDNASVTVLPTDFCTPEYAMTPSAVIIALDKPHASLRQLSWRVQLREHGRRLLRRTMQPARPIVRRLRRFALRLRTRTTSIDSSTPTDRSSG